MLRDRTNADALLSWLNRMPAVNAALPGPEREVLALLAEDELGYEEISWVLGIATGDVAALGGSGRLRMARALGLDASEAPGGPGHLDLGRLSASIDGDDRDAGHLRSCPPCRRLHVAMRAADRIYRNWASAPMPDAVRWRVGQRLRLACAAEDGR